MEEAGPAQEPRAGHYPHRLPGCRKATVCCVCFKSQLILNPQSLTYSPHTMQRPITMEILPVTGPMQCSCREKGCLALGNSQ